MTYTTVNLEVKEQERLTEVDEFSLFEKKEKEGYELVSVIPFVSNSISYRKYYFKKCSISTW